MFSFVSHTYIHKVPKRFSLFHLTLHCCRTFSFFFCDKITCTKHNICVCNRQLFTYIMCVYFAYTVYTHLFFTFWFQQQENTVPLLYALLNLLRNVFFSENVIWCFIYQIRWYTTKENLAFHCRYNTTCGIDGLLFSYVHARSRTNRIFQYQSQPLLITTPEPRQRIHKTYI